MFPCEFSTISDSRYFSVKKKKCAFNYLEDNKNQIYQIFLMSSVLYKLFLKLLYTAPFLSHFLENVYVCWKERGRNIKGMRGKQEQLHRQRGQSQLQTTLTWGKGWGKIFLTTLHPRALNTFTDFHNNGENFS